MPTNSTTKIDCSDVLKNSESVQVEIIVTGLKKYLFRARVAHLFLAIAKLISPYPIEIVTKTEKE